MTSDLHARLHDLTADAPAPSPALAGDLWRAGKRRQRRSRAAGALGVLALVAGLGGVGVTVQDSRLTPAPPAANERVPRLPAQLHEVSPWLPTTEEAGPIGPLALVVTGMMELDLVGGQPAYVGVSALTGAYRFLSLPDLPAGGDGATGDGIALSPDGTKVAYWYGGSYDEEFAALHPVGIAVYDTVTGDLKRHPIEAPWRIQAEKPVWVGDKVWISWFENIRDEPGAGENGQTASWSPEADELRRLPGSVWLPQDTGVAGGQVVSERRGAVRILDADGAVLRSVRPRGQYEGQLMLSPGGERLVGRADPDGDPSSFSDEPAPVLTAEVPAGCDGCVVDLEEVSGTDQLWPVGWRDDDHLVVTEQERVAAEEYRWSYRSLDLTTGKVTELVDPGGLGNGNYLFAGDAWTWETWDAPPPDDPIDPRAVLGGGLALALVSGLGAAVLWRRSRVGRWAAVHRVRRGAAGGAAPHGVPADGRCPRRGGPGPDGAGQGGAEVGPDR